MPPMGSIKGWMILWPIITFVVSYTCYSKIRLINSHASGQQLIAAGVRKELFAHHLQLYLIGQMH